VVPTSTKRSTIGVIANVVVFMRIVVDQRAVRRRRVQSCHDNGGTRDLQGGLESVGLVVQEGNSSLLLLLLLCVVCFALECRG